VTLGDHHASSTKTQGARPVVILGAGGYFGSSLCRFFHATPPYRVVALFRRQPNHGSFSDYVVADAYKENWSERISPLSPFVLINCAFDFSAIQAREDYRLKYALFERNIADLSCRGAAQLINISTMSAYPGCRSDYGREKLFLEELFNRHDGINVRLGMLASWQKPGSAFLTLISTARRSRVIPLPRARHSGFYFCDLEAALLGIFLLVNMKLNKPHTVSFCYPNRLTLRHTLDLIEKRYGLQRLKIAFPWEVAYPLLLAKEAAIGKSKVRADSLLDFAYPARTVFRRGIFARIIEAFRNDLEGLESCARTERDSTGFYFLEPPRRRASQPTRACRLKEIARPNVIASLGRVADV